MKAISYTKARSSFSHTMESVCADHSPIIITRKNAQPVVMISLEDFNAIEETGYLLKSPANASRLAKSINDIHAHRTVTKNINIDDNDIDANQ